MERHLPLVRFSHRCVPCSCLLSWMLAQTSFCWLADVLGLEMLMCLFISLMSHNVPLLLFCHVCIHFQVFDVLMQVSAVLCCIVSCKVYRCNNV